MVATHVVESKAPMLDTKLDTNNVAKSTETTNVEPAEPTAKITSKGVSVFYGEKQALFDVDLDIPENSVTSLIGPSGCGKSTYLRCINRMNDVIDICRVQGDINIDGQDIYDPSLDVVELRARIGMVFQKPNPFPKAFMITLLMAPAFTGLPVQRLSLMNWLRAVSLKLGSGMKSKIV